MTHQMETIQIYMNIENNLVKTTCNYIKHLFVLNAINNLEDFQNFYNIYIQQYYGSNGTEMFESLDECIEFVGDQHFDEVVELMKQSARSDNNGVINIVNYWILETLSSISIKRMYHEIVRWRQLNHECSL